MTKKKQCEQCIKYAEILARHTIEIPRLKKENNKLKKDLSKLKSGNKIADLLHEDLNNRYNKIRIKAKILSNIFLMSSEFLPL